MKRHSSSHMKQYLSEKTLPDVVILCGGKATRLQSVVSDRPKALAQVGGRPFLDIMLKKIFDQGGTRVILAVGHMKEQLIKAYAHDPRIVFSIEDTPLGTGGAAMKALRLAKTDHCIVMNGDGDCDFDLRELYRKHLAQKSLVSMTLVKMDDISDFGSVRVDDKNRILSFEEKLPQKRPGLINVGIYVFDKKVADYAPKQANFSLEYDVFPHILGQLCYGHVISGGMIDIGTPERYELAKQRFA